MTPRKCPDCGSLRFDQGGAAALDEAREAGFAQGAEWMREQAARECDGLRHSVKGAHRELGVRLAASVRSLPTSPPAPEEDK